MLPKLLWKAAMFWSCLNASGVAALLASQSLQLERRAQHLQKMHCKENPSKHTSACYVNIIVLHVTVASLSLQYSFLSVIHWDSGWGGFTSSIPGAQENVALFPAGLRWQMTVLLSELLALTSGKSRDFQLFDHLKLVWYTCTYIDYLILCICNIKN